MYLSSICNNKNLNKPKYLNKRTINIRYIIIFDKDFHQFYFNVNRQEDLGATTRYVHLFANITFSRHKIERKPASFGTTIRHVRLSYIEL